MKIDADAIRELAALLDETGLTEIEIGEGDQNIRVSKGGGTIVSAPSFAGAVAAPVAADIAAVPPSKHAGAVNSPMVGTVYLSPTPDAAPFVTAGSRVQEGQTILIIEAMKTMNYVKAEKSGCVIEILVKNGAHIEFGQSLVHID